MGGPAHGRQDGLEIAIDLRRSAEADVATRLKEALAVPPGAAHPGWVVLEPWVPASESCIWRFNALYWHALSRWEASTGREYEQALPGGQSDARNTAAAAEMIGELFAVWDGLDARHALPPELYIVELGVGNGSQARTWLDTFADLDRRHGREYYRRLHYLMGDYSAHVLDRARLAVAHHGDRVNGLVLDATRPLLTLGFLRGKAFCVYISNVYDNLPTDELATHRGPSLPGRGPCLPQRRGRGPDRGPPPPPPRRARRAGRAAAPAGTGPAGRGRARDLRRRRPGGGPLA